MRERSETGSIVTLLCDRGDRYAETLFSADWLAERGIALESCHAALRRAEFGAKAQTHAIHQSPPPHPLQPPPPPHPPPLSLPDELHEDEEQEIAEVVESEPVGTVRFLKKGQRSPTNSGRPLRP